MMTVEVALETLKDLAAASKAADRPPHALVVAHQDGLAQIELLRVQAMGRVQGLRKALTEAETGLRETAAERDRKLRAFEMQYKQDAASIDAILADYRALKAKLVE